MVFSHKPAIAGTDKVIRVCFHDPNNKAAASDPTSVDRAKLEYPDLTVETDTDPDPSFALPTKVTNVAEDGVYGTIIDTTGFAAGTYHLVIVATFVDVVVKAIATFDVVAATPEEVNTKLGTPVADVSSDLAAIDTKIGTPAGADVSADVAALAVLIQATSGVPHAVGNVVRNAAGDFYTYDVVINAITYRLTHTYDASDKLSGISVAVV